MRVILKFKKSKMDS